MASLHVRTSGDPNPLVNAVQAELQALDPNLPVEIHTLSKHMELSLSAPIMIGGVVGAFGLLALVLAIVGIYGVMSYSVSQRIHEFGIRAALGAGQQQLLKLVLRRGLGITLIGMGIGLAGAFALTRALAGFLVDVNPMDPAIFLGVTLTQLTVALLACYLPARWAARVDPVVALRYE